MEDLNNNYVGHPYARTLRFFDAYYHCPYYYSRSNYAELMLSMDKLTTIDELFNTRILISHNWFKSKIIEGLPIEICAPLAGRYEYTFRQDYRSVDELRRNMLQDVYDCFNTNIFRLFKESKEPTILSCGEYIVNLTDLSEKYDEQIKEIVQYAKDVYHIDAEELSKEIRSRKESFHNNLRKIKDLEKTTNDYQSAKQKIQDDLNFFFKYKWRTSRYDIERFKDFLPTNNTNGYSYIKDIIYNSDLRISVIGFVAFIGVIFLLSPILACTIIISFGALILFVIKSAAKDDGS